MADPTPTTPRILTIACLVATAVALGGLIAGFGQAPPGWRAPAATRAETPDGVLPAVPYLQMDGKARGPNRFYQSNLVTLVGRQPGLMDPVAVDPALREQAVARRAARRAYSGAPPVIPHPVDANDITSCYQCHGEGKVIDTVMAPRISHQRFTNCTQCHAQGNTPTPGEMPDFAIANTFQGLASPGRGSRAYLGAPPTIPHPTAMRENCTACHGLLGQQGLRTPHPWRVSCLQCHVPGADARQHPRDEPAPPPWAGETSGK